jgi:DNA replication protein DnaC
MRARQEPLITVGVGKTHIAQALGHNVARRGGEVRFAKTSRVVADLAGGHADRTWGARVREYTRPAVLILDDFGLGEHTAAQADDLYELISERAVNHKPLILTSNRRPADWYPLFPNPVVGAVISTGSSTPVTRSSWTVRPTGRGNGPAGNPRQLPPAE